MGKGDQDSGYGDMMLGMRQRPCLLKLDFPTLRNQGGEGMEGGGGRRVTTALLQIALCRAQIAPLFFFNMSHCPFAVTSDSGKRGFVQCRAQCSLR